MIFIACLLSFFDRLLLLCNLRWTDAGPRFFVTMPEALRLFARLIRPTRFISATWAAELMSLVLIGGIVTLGGGGAFNSDFLSIEKRFYWDAIYSWCTTVVSRRIFSILLWLVFWTNVHWTVDDQSEVIFMTISLKNNQAFCNAMHLNFAIHHNKLPSACSLL